MIDNPDFAITIGNATYTERVDGGTVMLEAISKCKTGETTPVGKSTALSFWWKEFPQYQLYGASWKDGIQGRTFHKSGGKYGKAGEPVQRTS